MELHCWEGVVVVVVVVVVLVVLFYLEVGSAFRIHEAFGVHDVKTGSGVLPHSRAPKFSPAALTLILQVRNSYSL